MIKDFKKDIIEEVEPMIDSWIESSYFKEIYSYVNAPNIDIKTRRDNLTAYMKDFFIKILHTEIPEKNFQNIYLQVKTLISAYNQITRRYKLMLKVSENMDNYFV